MMENSPDKALYIDWCSRYDFPLYMQHWWLDAVCEGGEWGVCLYNEQDIKGAMPFFKRRKWGFSMIANPLLTTAQHIWIKYPDEKTMKANRRLAIEQKVTAGLIDKLPKSGFFLQNFHYRFDNWLSFYWKGYRQTTRYTYVLEDLADTEAVYQNMEQSARTDIRKASEKVTVVTTEDVEKFYAVYTESFNRQNKKPPLTLSFLQKTDTALQKHRQRTIYLATDQENNVHAALYLAWDSHTAYSILSGGSTAFRSSGALYLLFWQAIQDSSDKGLKEFDFEGSMIAPIESMLRSLGGMRKNYMHIYKARNRWLAALLTLFGVKSWK